MRTVVSRPYKDQDDYKQMRELLMQARRFTSDWRYAHVGELAFNYFMIAIHLKLQDHIRLWHDEGKLVGFAVLGEDPLFDWQILPEYEWIGIEEEALTWAETRLVDLRKSDEITWGGELVSGSREDNPERIDFLEKHGFIYRGEFSEVNMILSLADPIPTPQVPDGFEVREFLGSSEIADRALIQREVWQPWSVGDVSEADYAFMTEMPGYEPALDIVTVSPDGVIAAYVNGWIDPVNKIGDLGPVGARENFRRRGLTRAAQLECLRRMKDMGMDRACISTGFSNIPAQQLYQSIGFKIVNRYLDYTKPNQKLQAN
jgi:ribosomal protein S18 acetylase RimI-like enzyme